MDTRFDGDMISLITIIGYAIVAAIIYSLQG